MYHCCQWAVGGSEPRDPTPVRCVFFSLLLSQINFTVCAGCQSQLSIPQYTFPFSMFNTTQPSTGGFSFGASSKPATSTGFSFATPTSTSTNPTGGSLFGGNATTSTTQPSTTPFGGFSSQPGSTTKFGFSSTSNQPAGSTGFGLGGGGTGLFGGKSRS